MIDMILDEASERMGKTIDSFKRDLTTVRTGRANPAMLDRVMVNYYGSPTPINQMAGISVVEGRQLVIKPYDKSVIKDIEHGIYEAELGLTPQNDGVIIRIMVPALTEDRRREFAKQVWNLLKMLRFQFVISVVIVMMKLKKLMEVKMKLKLDKKKFKN